MSMRTHHRLPRRRRESGTAAVEMALLSFVMAMILLAPIMVARSLMQVRLAQRAAYNAVHMIATYPPYLRLDTSSTPLAAAEAMAAEALTEGGIASTAIGTISAYCPGSAGCNNKIAPTVVGMDISADVLDPTSLLPTFTTVNVTTSASDRYAN